MARVIIFSTKFPAYHPKKGQYTFFVEKFRAAIGKEKNAFFKEPKLHTIRMGNRWKAGDAFSPRIWTGKPYASKQHIIAPDVKIKKVYAFEFKKGNYYVNTKKINLYQLIKLAMNDGLSARDLQDWFSKPFKGQVICWGKVKY